MENSTLSIIKNLILSDQNNMDLLAYADGGNDLVCIAKIL